MYNKFNLNGTWELAGCAEGKGKLVDGRVENVDIGPLEVQVPGEVHPSLLSAGLIPDPYYGMNAEEVQWVEEKEWWYSARLDLPKGFTKRKTVLKFDGLDTYATIWLNGRQVGRTANKFIGHSFDVTGFIKDGVSNTLNVRFDPPRVNARKKQCSIGCDQAHRLAGAGIWRGVDLVSYDRLIMSDIYVQPVLRGNDADAWIYISVDNFTGEDVEAQFVVIVARGDAREKVEFTEIIPAGGDVIESVIRIEEPELWYPNGSGDQPMYVALIGLSADGEIQDVREQAFGVRFIELVEETHFDEPGFTLAINGQSVFCKGANWVPADHFPSRVTAESYRELLAMARDANINIFRVRDGGIYEDPLFYNLCDEMGIMVWQEAGLVVKSLRNHPCIVLWCGSSENESAVEDLDGTRPFRPSGHCGLFISESPVQGPPMTDSIRKFIPEDQLFPPTLPVWDYHNENELCKGAANQLILERSTREMMGDFSNVEEFTRKGGVLQGEILKREIEHFRRLKWQAGGSLFWVYNDCWPAVSGSVVDYYQKPKVAYYYIKRAFEPVMVSFAPEEDGFSLWITNDTAASVHGSVKVSLVTFGSGVTDIVDIPAAVAANASAGVAHISLADIGLTDPSKQVLSARLISGGAVIARNARFFDVFRNISFPGARLDVRRQQLDESRHRIMLSAGEYARTVAVSGLPGGSVVSDNFFDLFPDDPHEIIIEGISAMDASTVGVSVWR